MAMPRRQQPNLSCRCVGILRTGMCCYWTASPRFTDLPSKLTAPESCLGRKCWGSTMPTARLTMLTSTGMKWTPISHRASWAERKPTPWPSLMNSTWCQRQVNCQIDLLLHEITLVCLFCLMRSEIIFKKPIYVFLRFMSVFFLHLWFCSFKEGPAFPNHLVPLHVSVQKSFSRELCCNDEFFTSYLGAFIQGE